MRSWTTSQLIFRTPAPQIIWLTISNLQYTSAWKRPCRLLRILRQKNDHTPITESRSETFLYSMLSSMTPWRYAAFCIPREIWINCSAIDRLIMVYRMGVIPSGLLIVASLIQCLPVRTIPEELRVSLVWNDMVHNRRRCCFSFLQALLAEWMKCQELLTLQSPSRTVSFRCSRAALFRMQSFVFLAVLLSGGHEVRTAGMPARNLRFVWYVRHLRS